MGTGGIAAGGAGWKPALPGGIAAGRGGQRVPSRPSSGSVRRRVATSSGRRPVGPVGGRFPVGTARREMVAGFSPRRLGRPSLRTTLLTLLVGLLLVTVLSIATVA